MFILKRSLAFAFIIVLLCGCKKSGDHPFSIEGQWQLRRSFGGGGMFDTIYPPNQQNLLVFHASAYTWTKGAAEIEHGTYHLESPVITFPDVADPTIMILYLYAADTLRQQIYQSRDTLILNFGAPAIDGIEHIFIRQ